MIFSSDNNSILCSSLSMRMRVASLGERQVRRERKSAEYKIELRDACYSKRIKARASTVQGFPRRRGPMISDNWGCPRIAEQIALAFNMQIDKHVVHRILAHHHRPRHDSDGPSWLTFLGHIKDSLWSIDLFRCESATLRTHWVLVVMDQYTRRIIGLGVHAGKVDGATLCRMFNRASREHRWLPEYLSSDNDPLYRFHQWQANLRILEVTKSSPSPTFPCQIRSWKGKTAPLDASI
jgi:transposase InsO family protein